MSTKQWTRRQFFRLSGVAVVGSALASACGATPTPTPVPPTPAPATATKAPAAAATAAPAAPPTAAPAAPTAAPAAPTTAPAAPTATKAAAPTVAAPVGAFKEAPMLADLVKAGKIPAVDQRLPVNPMVVKPAASVGQYGGTWRMSLLGAGDTMSMDRVMGYEPLLRWASDYGGSYLPNVAESITSNPDGSVYTVKLRKGMKWSDGTPFTTADIKFWYDDVLLNKDYTPAVNPFYVAAGKTVEVAVTDDTTFAFKFAGPYGFFPLRLAHNLHCVWYPAQYMKQFHKTYAADIDKKVADAGAKTWVDLFKTKENPWLNIAKPTLFGWNLAVASGSNATLLTAPRSPYFFKVDTAGNQLPYIDTLQFTQHQAIDTLTLQALNGEIDYQYRHFGTLNNKSVFFDNQQKGAYALYSVGSAQQPMIIYLNLSSVDPVLGPLFRNKDFRIGLSYGVNRKELIDLLYYGQATPSQFAPSPKGPFANQQMSTQYTEYDPKKANEYLDKAGVNKRDSEGFRLRPDGKRLTILAEVATAPYAEQGDGMNLVKKTWKDIGVDLNVKLEDRTIQFNNKQANQHEIFVWAAGGADGIDVILNCNAYFPDRSAASGTFQAPGWGDWYASGGKSGIEPDAEIKKMMSLYTELQKKSTWEDQVKGMKEIIQISADYFPEIGICTQPDLFGIVKNNFKNTPTRPIDSATMYSPGPSNPEQFYFAK